MGNTFKSLFLMSFFTIISSNAFAHFVELIPSQNVITPESGRDVKLETVFTHPFEGGPLMTFVKPEQMGVQFMGEKTSLLDDLKQSGDKADLKWVLDYQTKRAGDYTFYIEPKPYFEPAEGKFIIHYTKTIVHKDMDNGWDEPVGFPVEIMPLTRPYGIWTNNLFRGVVLYKGKPMPNTPVEVEHKNLDGVKAPNDSFITQQVVSDENGIFAYNIPKSGWWGFAALVEDGETMKTPDGTDYPIEKGGLIWIHTEDIQ